MAFWKRYEETKASAGSKDGERPRVNSGTSSAVADAIKPKANATLPVLSLDQLRTMSGTAKATMAIFGEIVSLLMGLPQYRNYALSDLEWLVVPAVLTGQFSFATAQSKTKGSTAPVGLVLWASVSEEVDKRLSAVPGQPIKLRPQECKSGDILWVIMAVGDQRVVQGMVKRLQAKEWANKPAKIFAQAKDGKATIATLESKAA